MRSIQVKNTKMCIPQQCRSDGYRMVSKTFVKISRNERHSLCWVVTHFRNSLYTVSQLSATPASKKLLSDDQKFSTNVSQKHLLPSWNSVVLLWAQWIQLKFVNKIFYYPLNFLIILLPGKCRKQWLTVYDLFIFLGMSTRTSSFICNIMSSRFQPIFFQRILKVTRLLQAIYVSLTKKGMCTAKKMRWKHSADQIILKRSYSLSSYPPQSWLSSVFKKKKKILYQLTRARCENKKRCGGAANLTLLCSKWTISREFQLENSLTSVNKGNEIRKKRN